eukprot:scaffold25736_cov117-Cylindrotheca_fusiformis.AAC.3
MSKRSDLKRVDAMGHHDGRCDTSGDLHSPATECSPSKTLMNMTAKETGVLILVDVEAACS